MSQNIAREVQLIEEEKVFRARLMSPEEKFRAGADLFEEACQWTLAGIAFQMPQLDEVVRHEELKHRLSMFEASSILEEKFLL